MRGERGCATGGNGGERIGWWKKRIAIRASLNVRRARRIDARARAVCASRILKTYTSDGKSGVKYKSVMPPKNSVGTEPPVFHPSPRCSSPFLAPSFLACYSAPPESRRFFSLSPSLSLCISLSLFSFILLVYSLNAHCVLRCTASAQVRFRRMLDRANEITPRSFFALIEGERLMRRCAN